MTLVCIPGKQVCLVFTKAAKLMCVVFLISFYQFYERQPGESDIFLHM